MDMLPFTDDIHKRSASFSTACLIKSDSTLVRSIAEFVIGGRCRTAGWNCFRMATAVRSSVNFKLMASVLRRTSPTYVASNSSSLDAVAGSDLFYLQRLLDQRAYLMVLLARDCIAYRGWPKKSKPQSFVHIFAKYGPIFKIFSLLHSVKNLQ